MTLLGTTKWLAAALVAATAVTLLPATGRCDENRVLLILIELARRPKPMPPKPCAAPHCPLGVCRGAATMPCCPLTNHQGTCGRSCEAAPGCNAEQRCTAGAGCRISKPEHMEQACRAVNRDPCTACAAALEQQAEELRRLCAAQEQTLREMAAMMEEMRREMTALRLEMQILRQLPGVLQQYQPMIPFCFPQEMPLPHYAPMPQSNATPLPSAGPDEPTATTETPRRR